MFRFITDHFSPRRAPLMTRHNYARELVTAATFPWSMALIEGGVISVLAEKAFDAPPFAIALFSAAPMIANLTSIVWAHIARGRKKIPLYVAIIIAQLVLIAAIGLLPTTPAGLWSLVAIVIIARCLFAGILTLRSTIWRQNYPRNVRGRITGRLAQLATACMVTASLVASIALEQHPDSYRLLYPVAALVASLAVLAIARIRVRGQRALLKYETQPAAQPTPHGEAAPIYEYDPQDKNFSIWSVLSRDPTFRRYMVWQFFIGVANMMSEPIVYTLLADELYLNLSYVVAIALSMVIPTALASITLPVWGRMLDGMHIANFRVRQGFFWIASLLMLALAGYLITHNMIAYALLAMFFARLSNGFARGAGILAWQLGHNDFASRQHVALYMGIHQMLTGIRGCFAPFLGVALYFGWPANWSSATSRVIPAFSGIGYVTFLITSALALIATVGFYSLAHAAPRTAHTINPPPAIQPIQSPLMRIATYNILSGGTGRLDPIAETLRFINADITALIEADCPDALAYLAQPNQPPPRPGRVAHLRLPRRPALTLPHHLRHQPRRPLPPPVPRRVARARSSHTDRPAARDRRPPPRPGSATKQKPSTPRRTLAHPPITTTTHPSPPSSPAT